MKIGIFDSGLGGLVMTHAIINRLSTYDYLYLGDTKHVPYGDRSEQEIFEFTRAGVAYLFEHNCALIIIACNTASAQALRRLQQEWLPLHYPERRILGVIIPTAEAVDELSGLTRIGLIATTSTVRSGSFEMEIGKLVKSIELVSVATPDLVPLIEGRVPGSVADVFSQYAKQLTDAGIEALLLGCTHYPLIAQEIQRQIGTPVISQTDIVPAKLQDYLKRHAELSQFLTQGASIEYRLTRIDTGYGNIIKRWFGQELPLTLVSL